MFKFKLPVKSKKGWSELYNVDTESQSKTRVGRLLNRRLKNMSVVVYRKLPAPCFATLWKDS